MVIIFPLRDKIGTLFLQQRPRWTGGRMIPVSPVLPFTLFMNRPNGNNFGRYNLPPIAVQSKPITKPITKPISKPIRPSVVHSLLPMPTETFEIIGVSKNSSGVALAGCTMNLFRLDYDSGNNLIYTHLGNVISDASGNYVFVVNKGSTYRITADNATGPVMGVTVNTLTGTLNGN